VRKHVRTGKGLLNWRKRSPSLRLSSGKSLGEERRRAADSNPLLYTEEKNVALYHQTGIHRLLRPAATP
jgi:hypothetical protein